MKLATPKKTTTFGNNFIVFRFNSITFHAGTYYRVTDRDWFGRPLYELEKSDEWFHKDDLIFTTLKELSAKLNSKPK